MIIPVSGYSCSRLSLFSATGTGKTKWISTHTKTLHRHENLNFSWLAERYALFAHSTHKQRCAKNFSFGLGLEGGLPTGDVKEAYNVAGGLTLRLSYKVGSGFATLTTGGIAFIPESLEGEDVKAGLLIPVKAGYKYIIQDRFFLMGEVGYGSFKRYYADENDELASFSDGGFAFAPTVGIQFNVVELGLRYKSVSLPGGSLSFLGLMVGFNF